MDVQAERFTVSTHDISSHLSLSSTHHSFLSGPLEDIIDEYEAKSFVGGYPEYPSEYSAEPSDELDELWHSLYPSE